MDNAEADVSRDEVRRTVKRAILLNEHLLRRAWGVLYLALALSMFFSTFGVAIIGSLAVAGSLGILGDIAMAMAASGCGLVAVLWAFKRVRNTAEITHPEGNRAWSRLVGYRFLVPIWIALNGVVILTAELARARIPLIDFLVHLGLAFYLYYALRLSFSKKIPVEAFVAIASLSLSSIVSIAILSITTSAGPYALLWGATIVLWIFSGVYARTRPVPEFEEERTGLE
ncbi:MAG: hypothetical protein ACRD6W_10165 [Nitrososphaerales archaeon]